MDELVRKPSASTAGMQRHAVAKTPLGRMLQVVELGRRCRQIEKMAHGPHKPDRPR